MAQHPVAITWLKQLFPGDDQDDVAASLGGLEGLDAIYNNLINKTQNGFSKAVEAKLATSAAGRADEKEDVPPGFYGAKQIFRMPILFRKELCEQVLETIIANGSAALRASPSTGKSTVLRQTMDIAALDERFGDPILIDCSELSPTETLPTVLSKKYAITWDELLNRRRLSSQDKYDLLCLDESQLRTSDRTAGDGLKIRQALRFVESSPTASLRILLVAMYGERASAASRASLLAGPKTEAMIEEAGHMQLEQDTPSLKSFSAVSTSSSLVAAASVFGLHSGPKDFTLAFSLKDLADLVAASSLNERWWDLKNDNLTLDLLHRMTAGVIGLVRDILSELAYELRNSYFQKGKASKQLRFLLSSKDLWKLLHKHASFLQSAAVKADASYTAVFKKLLATPNFVIKETDPEAREAAMMCRMGLLHAAPNGHLAFISPIHRDYYDFLFNQSANINFRAWNLAAWSDLQNFLVKCIASMSSACLRNTRSLGVDKRPYERLYQMEFFRVATMHSGPDASVSPDVGAMYTSEGYLDFYLSQPGKNKGWAIELLRDHDDVDGHCARFIKGAYTPIPVHHWCIIDFVSPTIAEKKGKVQHTANVFRAYFSDDFESCLFCYDKQEENIMLSD